MKKLSILSMLLLFISMGNIQAQTVKEESRKQKKAEQEFKFLLQRKDEED